MNATTEAILAFWEEPRNIPFKGSLISNEPPSLGMSETTCMCAQGQVLHLQGGYSEEDLRKVEQREADEEVAKLLEISVAHSVLLRTINDSQDGAPSDVLTNPEKYLGPNYQKVLEFWFKLDTLTQEHFEIIDKRYNENYSSNLSHRIQLRATFRENYPLIFDVAYCSIPSGPLSIDLAAECATWELILDVENPVHLKMFDQ